MKDVELKLVSELMKNSRRSDRELARAIGVSQPTVSRMIKKLERAGIVREYTIVPDFVKLGYHILALTFVKLKKEAGTEEIRRMKETIQTDLEGGGPLEVVMFERGLGLECSAVLASFHEDYSSYTRLKEKTKNYGCLDFSGCQSFLISLDDRVHYRPLTFSTLAKHLQPFRTKAEPEPDIGMNLKAVKTSQPKPRLRTREATA
jgi:Lrp/AsnC family leucine-responsive transcriptional regulator